MLYNAVDNNIVLLVRRLRTMMTYMLQVYYYLNLRAVNTCRANLWTAAANYHRTELNITLYGSHIDESRFAFKQFENKLEVETKPA